MIRGDRHAAEGNYAAEAARRRRRSPQSGFFLVGNCGKGAPQGPPWAEGKKGTGTCPLAWKKETGLLCTGTGEYAYLITRK